MSWHIETLNSKVDEELNSLEPSLKAKFLYICELLKDFGPNLVGTPHIKPLGNKLWKIRMRGKSGIARAIYHKPQILILDEATSSLDNITEQTVINSINNLENKITIIQIAHRISTVKNCDNIFFLKKGQLIGQGTYDELFENSEQFRSMNKSIN